MFEAKESIDSIDKAAAAKGGGKSWSFGEGKLFKQKIPIDNLNISLNDGVYFYI